MLQVQQGCERWKKKVKRRVGIILNEAEYGGETIAGKSIMGIQN